MGQHLDDVARSQFQQTLTLACHRPLPRLPSPPASFRTPAFVLRHPLDPCHLAEHLPRGPGGSADPPRSGRHVVHQAALCCRAAPLADAEMVDHTGLAADHRIIAHRYAAGNSGLAHDNAMAADHDVVANLDEVVDLGPLADHRVADGAAVDRRAGADLDVVLDDDAADLRHLDVAARAHERSRSRPGRSGRRDG